jgi:hypothetical protein
MSGPCVSPDGDRHPPAGLSVHALTDGSDVSGATGSSRRGATSGALQPITAGRGGIGPTRQVER